VVDSQMVNNQIALCSNPTTDQNQLPQMVWLAPFPSDVSDVDV